MQLTLYVIKRTTIDDCISYLTWKDTSSKWRPFDMVDDIHFFSKKSLAEHHLTTLTVIYPDVLSIEQVRIEVD